MSSLLCGGKKKQNPSLINPLSEGHQKSFQRRQQIKMFSDSNIKQARCQHLSEKSDSISPLSSNTPPYPAALWSKKDAGSHNYPRDVWDRLWSPTLIAYFPFSYPFLSLYFCVWGFRWALLGLLHLVMVSYVTLFEL